MNKRRPYQQTLTRTWWTKRKGYRAYMIRELTSIFVLLFSIELYFALFFLVKGEQSWMAFLNVIQSPAGLLINGAILIATLWHTVTWFQLTPITMPFRVKGKKVSENAIIGAHYGLLLVISLLVVWILRSAL